MRNIVGIERMDCTGCTACAGACPNDAVRLKKDREGFLYPYVDPMLCDTECEECFQVCPVLHKPVQKENSQTYVVMAADEIRKETSSGGAFDVLARYVLDKSGVVAGAWWTEDWRVEHAVISSHKELRRFHDIKYAESDLNDIFREIKEYLKKGILVLFSGFQCQIKGLLNYLKDDFGNLVTYEVLCRGIPSQKAVKRYVKDHIGLQKINGLYFRKKEPFGWGTSNSIYYNDTSSFLQKHSESEWWDMYQRGVAFRESCYQCDMTEFPRYSDFSSCDYWEVSKQFPKLNDGLGASLLFVNSAKAANIFEVIRERLYQAAEIPFEQARKRTEAVYKKIERPYGRNEFYRDLEKSSLTMAIQDTEKEHFDVGIIGYWYALNYGSALTYYALYDVLSRLGFRPVIIETTFDKSAMEHKNTISRNFMSQYAAISPYYGLNESFRISKLCDSFVVGSDQVWTADAVRLLGRV